MDWLQKGAPWGTELRFMWCMSHKTRPKTEKSQGNKWAFSLACISETLWSDTYRCSINVWWVNGCLCPFIQHVLSIYVITKQIHTVYKVLWFLPSENSQWILRDYDVFTYNFWIDLSTLQVWIYPLHLLLQIHATSFSSVCLLTKVFISLITRTLHNLIKWFLFQQYFGQNIEMGCLIFSYF